jgi:V8-like Glu-specific endopeptidase
VSAAAVPPRRPSPRAARTLAGAVAGAALLGLAPAGAGPVAVPERAAGRQALAAPARVASPAPLAPRQLQRTAAGSSRQAQLAIRGYWTAARMAAARPVEQPVEQYAGQVDALDAGTAAGTRFSRGSWLDPYLRRIRQAPTTNERPDPGSAWRSGGTVVRTTGKVFFSMGADDYVCSGSAVSSPDRSTVLTAGHCVYDPQTATTATNWAFVPAYADGKAPYGVFAARRLATTTGWRTDEDYDLDVAFADVGANGAGVALTDAVGGQPIAFNTARGGLLHAFGYPAAFPWTGERMIHCSRTVVQDTTGGSQDQGMTCSMTPGSSGGPWFAGFSTRTGRGTLVSVTSFSYSDRPGVLWGPYLGATAKALYDAVASTPGK